MLNELSVGVSTSDPREFIRAATCRLIFDMRSGTLDLGDSDLAWELLPVLGEPLIQTGFESIYANALALAARYTDALEVANTLLHTALKYRLDFARPYGLVSAAMGQAGRRTAAQYDWPSVAGRVLAFYERVLARTRAAQAPPLGKRTTQSGSWAKLRRAAQQ